MRNTEQQRYHQMKRAAIRIQVIPEGGFYCVLWFIYFFNFYCIFFFDTIIFTDVKEWHLRYFPECISLASENI